jgi:hypothetical protein
MAGPYLKSGESIVLTTDRVRIDDAEYDLILTSQRLALVDSDHTSDQPRVVPFATIISVNGGTTPAREPVITLTVIDPFSPDEAKTLDMVFSQQPYQDRSAECDLWVKKLIEYIVSVRQEPAAEKQVAAEKTNGIHPSIRRFIAPDVPLPHTELSRDRRPSEDLLSAMQGAAWKSENDAAEKQAPEGDIIPDHTLPEPEENPLSPVPPTGDEDIPPGADTGEPVPGIHETGNTRLTVNRETLHDMQVQDRESTVPEESPGPTSVPATPFRELVPVAPGEVSDYPAPVPPDGRQAGRADDIEELSRQIEEIEPVQAGENAASRPGAGEPTGIPDNVVFPVLFGSAPDEAAASASPATPKGEVGAAGQTPAPQPEKRGAGTLLVIAIVLLVIVGMTAMILLSPAGNANGSNLPPVMPNVTSPTVTTVPSVTVPTTGVWVKVTYNGTFVGSYGNPGPTDQREVRGTGEQVYPIRNSNETVQASFRKLDDSGNPLTVDVYNNGIIVTHVSKSSPGAEIDILVDPVTGKPPNVPGTNAGV